YVAEHNAACRQLTPEQKTTLGRESEPDIRARAAKRQKELAGSRPNSHSASPSGHMSGRSETRDEVARTVQLGSGRTYERNNKLIDEVKAQPDGDQLYRHIESGDWTFEDAKKELKTRQRESERKAMDTPELMVSPETRQT